MRTARKRIIIWLLLLAFCVCSIPVSADAISTASPAPTSDGLSAQYMYGTWEGTYAGTSGGTSITRSLMIEIDYCDENGVLEGYATVDSGSVKYFLSGNVNFETGDISFAGSEWIHNAAGFNSFAEFGGTVDYNSGNISGFIDDDTTKLFSLTKTSSEYHSYRVDIATLPTDWIGEYDGQHNNVVVRRNIEIYISNITEKGIITGTAVLSPSEKADDAYAASGSYYFSGTVNFRTGSIFIQGYEWISYPEGYDNFTFVELSGFINQADSTISGTTDNGIWEMTSLGNENSEVLSLSIPYLSATEACPKLPAKYSDAFFSGSSYYYNDELAWLSLCLELSSWSADEKENWGDDGSDTSSAAQGRYANIASAYDQMDFDVVDYYNYGTTLNDTGDKVAFSIAEKKDVGAFL